MASSYPSSVWFIRGVYWLLFAEACAFAAPIVVSDPSEFVGACAIIAFIFACPTLVIAYAGRRGQGACAEIVN